MRRHRVDLRAESLNASPNIGALIITYTIFGGFLTIIIG